MATAARAVVRPRRPSPEVGFWLAVLEELVKLGRRYPVAALLVITAIVGAAVGAFIGWLVTGEFP